MTVPDHIKWTTHRPVIVAAPDWPEMPELKAHAAGLGADVEVSRHVQAGHLRIVWVPHGFTGSAADRVAVQGVEMVAASVHEAHDVMRRFAAGAGPTAAALGVLLGEPARRARVSRMHAAYAAKRR
ncbi:hypothetical protein [Micromonospora sp. WMMD737]|uniref:hypothetical protein n=1 Tax=Micromonospora sp. WMMD737 TaxID=3404113 RepID=UPI003B923922